MAPQKNDPTIKGPTKKAPQRVLFVRSEDQHQPRHRHLVIIVRMMVDD